MFARVVFARSHVPRLHVSRSHTIPAVNEWRTKKRMWPRLHCNGVHIPPLRFYVSTLPIPSSTFHISTFHILTDTTGVQYTPRTPSHVCLNLMTGDPG